MTANGTTTGSTRYTCTCGKQLCTIFNSTTDIGRVERWRGDRSSVSTSRSSNRTGGFPASGLSDKDRLNGNYSRFRWG